MRIVALAYVALVLGCRAEAVGEPPVVTGVEPRVGGTSPEPRRAEMPATADTSATSSTTVATTTTTAPASTIVPASTTSTTKPEGERDRPPAGCITKLDDLPASELVDARDRRLERDALVVVSKSARRLMLYDEGKMVGCWRVALGFAPVGHKEIQGDGRTPEGWYRTSDKPWSSFDNAIAIHYPNAVDARAAASDGRIGKRTRDAIVGAIEGGKVPPQNTKLGGAVLIHGGGSSFDWTLGCIALDDDELLALREQLPKGMRTDVLILP